MLEKLLQTLPNVFYKALDEISKHPWVWKPCFDWVSHGQRDGVYLVSLGNKYAFYKRDDNKYLVDAYFDMAQPFGNRHEFTRIKIDDKYNMLNINGHLLLDEWVDYIDYNIWEENTFVIQYNDSNRYTIIDCNGETLYDGTIPPYRVTTKR